MRKHVQYKEMVISQNTVHAIFPAVKRNNFWPWRLCWHPKLSKHESIKNISNKPYTLFSLPSLHIAAELHFGAFPWMCLNAGICALQRSLSTKTEDSGCMREYQAQRNKEPAGQPHLFSII